MTPVRTLTPHSSEFKVWNLYFQSCVLRYTINAPPLLKNTKYLKNVLKPNDNTYHCIKMYPVGPPGISRVHGTRLYCASTIDHDDITATFSSNPFIKTVEWEMLDKRWKQYLQYRVKGGTYIQACAKFRNFFEMCEMCIDTKFCIRMRKFSIRKIFAKTL